MITYISTQGWPITSYAIEQHTADRRVTGERGDGSTAGLYVPHISSPCEFQVPKQGKER